VIPISIGNLLTEIGLAKWIMDDGFFKYGLTLQTNAYTNHEVELLISVIFKNFCINSYIRFEQKRPIIYIPAENLNLIKSLVLNHMVPSTYYKLGIK
jgi:hypothetical protein